MVWIIVLGVILLVLGLVLFTPILVRVIREESLLVRLQIGPAKIQVYPPKEEASEEGLPEGEEKKKKEPKEKPKKKRKPITAEQVLYLLEQAPPILGRALRRVSRRVRIRPLKVHVLLSAADPADTGLLYGKVEAALAAGLPVLHRYLHIRDQDIRLYPDFEGQGMDWRLDVGVSLRLWDLLVVALCAGASALRLLIYVKRMAGGETAEAPTEKNNGKNNGAGKADAA